MRLNNLIMQPKLNIMNGSLNNGKLTEESRDTYQVYGGWWILIV